MTHTQTPGDPVAARPLPTAARLIGGLTVGAVGGVIAALLAPWQGVPLLVWVAPSLT